jgi:hypothetical protein
MISEKQLAANRRNAERSTGARTPAGKARSSLNNLRHGLTGQINILPTEDREAHDAAAPSSSTASNPKRPWNSNSPTPLPRTTGVATFDKAVRPYPRDVLATRITCGRRARAIENNMFALGHQGEHRELQIALADARTFQAQANQFQLLTIY